MRKIDHRMTPAWNFDLALVSPDDGRCYKLGLLEQTKHPGFLNRNRFNVCQLRHRRCHIFLRIDIKLDLHPFDRLVLQCADALLALARFDGQQAHIGFLRTIVEDFGWAHRGAPDIGWQQTLSVAGEEHGIDQLGLATRELREERQHDAVISQAFDEVVNSQAATDISVAMRL